jgi:hypothetical protein
VGDEFDTPKDEGAHDDVAEFGVGLYECEQALPLELDHFPTLPYAHADQRVAAGEHSYLSGELPRAVGGDERFRSQRGPDHFQFTGGDDEERDIWVTLLDEDLAGGRGASRSLRRDALHLWLGERWEDLFYSRTDGRDSGISGHECLWRNLGGSKAMHFQ